MNTSTLKVLSFLFLFLLSFTGCGKKDKTKPAPPVAPAPEEVLTTYSLDSYSGTPGDLISITTGNPLKQDTVSISVGGEKAVLYKINDTVAMFRLPVLSRGRVTIDLSSVSGKPVNFTVSEYVPITSAETVKKIFTDSLDRFLEGADTPEDQGTVSQLRGLKTVFLSEYQKLTDKEKLEAAYFLEKLNRDAGAIRRSAGVARLADTARSGTGSQRSFKEEFEDRALWFIAKAGFAYGFTVTGLSIFLFPAPTGVEKLGGVALIIAGVKLIKPAKKAFRDLADLIYAHSSFSDIKNWEFSSGRKVADTAAQRYLRDYDLVFMPGEKQNIQIPSVFHSLSQKNFNQSEFYTSIFDMVDNLMGAYNKIKGGLDKVRSWGSFFADKVPALPVFENPVPAQPKSEIRMTPAEEIIIENVSDQHITLKTNANGGVLSIAATGNNIKKATAFTFEVVYRDEELGIHNRMAVEAIYVASGLSVNAAASADAAIASVTGGVPPYAFKWSNGKKDSILYKLKPGDYTVIVTDAMGSTATASVTIAPDCRNSNLRVSILQTGITATATANGGSPAYTYAWSNGETSRTIGNLKPGKYTVIVTDANGCSSSAETTVEDGPDDGDESDPDKNPLSADAAAVKEILSANGMDISDTSWNSQQAYALYNILSKNGCAISNDRVVGLELKGKGLTVLPDAIGRLTALTSLNLSGNRVISIPDSIASLESLTSLNLSDNLLTDIPEGIGNLKNIWFLNLAKNKLSRIPDSISTLINLSSLNLSDNQLSALPQQIGSLTRLTSLSLNNNKLAALPNSIGNLVNLSQLSLDKNQLSGLPSSLGNLTKLTFLSLQENQLPGLPPSIGNLTQLTVLYLHQNQLATLPKEVGNLSRLTTLTLYENQLAELPEEIGNLTQLTAFDLQNNRLTALPSTVGNLVNLTRMQLSYNNLSAIPSAVGSLTQLTYLSLTKNQLTEIPSSIGNLSKLKQLYLHYNQLTGLPSTIGNLGSLEDLILSENLLSSVPSSIGNLTSLKKFDVLNNRLSCLPKSIWNLSLQILEWRGNRRTKADGKDYGLCSFGDTECSDIPCSEQ